MTDTLQITLNGEPREVPPQTTVAALLKSAGIDLDTGGIAVAVGDRVVPRSQWTQVRIEAGVQVEIVRATAGG